MSTDRARISPEVLKALKVHLIKYEETCRQAVAGIRTDSHRVLQWLRHDQLTYWKQELRKREDAVERARSAYVEARFATPGLRKASHADEQRALRRAELSRDEARRKIEVVKKWAGVVEQQTDKLLGPVNALSNSLDVDSPKAHARLEKMMLNLEGYLSGVAAEPGQSL